jgi:hypothetical protein
LKISTDNFWNILTTKWTNKASVSEHQGFSLLNSFECNFTLTLEMNDSTSATCMPSVLSVSENFTKLLLINILLKIYLPLDL